MDTTKRRKPVTLTIAQDVMAAAKALHLNASQAAEAGIRAAVSIFSPTATDITHGRYA